MPLLATPRSSAGLIVRSTAGRYDPTVATATWIPARTLRAPQTICSGSAVLAAAFVVAELDGAIRTVQTLSLSALGWGSRAST